ncbi:MAG: vWA domain-containing protein [Blastocatellia bacterium]
MFTHNRTSTMTTLRRRCREFVMVLMLCLLNAIPAQAQDIQVFGDLDGLLKKGSGFLFIVNPKTMQVAVGDVGLHIDLTGMVNAGTGSGYVRGFFNRRPDGTWVMNFENIQDYDTLPGRADPEHVKRWKGEQRERTIRSLMERLVRSPGGAPIVREAAASGGTGVVVAIDGRILPNIRLASGAAPVPLPEGAVTAAPPGPPLEFTDPVTQQLYEMIRDTPLAQMDLEFFKKVYATPEATRRLKEIFGMPEDPFPEKNRRLSRLRIYYELLGQAEYARNKNLSIENTNQGKQNGVRSDLDLTSNLLVFDFSTGKWRMTGGGVEQLRQHQQQRYQRDGLTSPEKVDVNIYNGDNWLPDWRNSRQSYDEFKRETMRQVLDLKKVKGAYFVPGAFREQAYDRALAEGRTAHVGWDYLKNVPTLNGRPFEFDAKTGEIIDAEFKVPFVEISTRAMAESGGSLRYEGVEVAEPREAWRRSFGNVVQNTKEFLTQDDPTKPADPEQAINRNKYFIERVIDQGVGRFTDYYRLSYIDVHGSALPDDRKNEWKRNFIQKAFGLPQSDTARIAEIQRVLDRSAEIQLDKTGKWHDGHTANYTDQLKKYFADEIAEMERKFDDWYQNDPNAPNRNEWVMKNAERSFVEKQRRLMIESAVRVIEESFYRDFTPEGRDRFNRDLYGKPDVAKKIMFERGVELALLMDIIETAPNLTMTERDVIRQRVINAIPSGAQPLVMKLAELSSLRMRLVGRAGTEQWFMAGDRPSELRPTELLAQAEQEMQRLLGKGESQTVSDEAIRKAVYETILQHLGPIEAREFTRAWEAGRLSLARMAATAGGAYWDAIKEQMDFLMVTGAAFGMIQSYQQHCAGQLTWNEACLTGLGWEAANQTLYMLPGINSGWMIVSGLRELRAGKPEGFIQLGLGVASIPSVAQGLGASGAAFIKIYVTLQILRLGYGITIGYAMQVMENDAIEQAFKALPEGIPPSRRYSYPGQPSFGVMQALTPDVPLLLDVIKVPAAAWDEDKRFDVAREMFAADVQAELDELGLQTGTAAWKNKRLEIIRRHASALPYVQRTQKMYEYFHPLVEAEGTEFPGILESCVKTGQATVEEKYKAPPSLWNRLRYWYDEKKQLKDKQDELGQVWKTCLPRAVKQESASLNAVFNKYLDGWFKLQSDKYRDKYDTPDMREKLRGALSTQYVVQRYLDLNREAASDNLKKTARIASEVADSTKKIWSGILSLREKTSKDAQAKLDSEATSAYAGKPPEVTPLFKLKAPDYAVRLGVQSAFLDIAARGQYYGDVLASNQWKALLTTEIVGAVMEKPAYVVMTKALEEELKPGAYELARKFVKVTEKITGELQYGGKKQAAETTINYFDILPWEGEITVEVRAAGPKTKTFQEASGYWSGTVKLSGPVQDEKSTGPKPAEVGDPFSGTRFSKLPAGQYSIRVEPHQYDKEHQAAEAKVDLTDFTTDIGWVPDLSKPEDQEWKVLTVKRFDKYPGRTPDSKDGKDLVVMKWKDRVVVNVLLPYVEPPKQPETQAQNKPPTQTQPTTQTQTTQTQGQQPGQPGKPGQPGAQPGGQPGKPGQTGQTTTGQTTQPDPRTVQECQSLLSQAQQALAAGNAAEAAGLLQQAQQKNCGGLTSGLGTDITNLQQQLEGAANQLGTQLQQALNAATCEFEGALQLVEQLRQINPNHPALSGMDYTQLAQRAAAQREARNYLRAGKAAIESKNLDGAISALASALAVPNLPACMRPPMEALKKELEIRKEFIALTEQVEEASKQCDYTKAQQVVGRITKLTPRYDFINNWISTEVPKLSELIQRRQKALQLIKDADTLATQAATAAATEPVDQARVGQLIQQAISKLDEADRTAPKCMQERGQMDAIRQKCRDIQQKKSAEIQTSIVLLIDTSGSMGSNNKIENAKAAARAAVRNVSKTNEMAILNFDGDCSGGAVRYACLFTTDLNALLAAIDGLRPGGGTPMYIATGIAVDYAKKKGRGKSATVVLMSDGGDTCRDKQAEAAAVIRQSNITVNTIGYDVGNSKEAQGDLANLATLTGGRNYSASTADPKEIINAFKLAMLPSLFKDFEEAQGGGGAVAGHFAAAKQAIRQQDLNGANYQLQQAQRLAPNSAAVNYNLALVNEASDKPLAAIRNAENYLRLAPNALDRADVENRIAQMRKEAEANPRAEYDPAACRDVFNWALTEREAAKKAGNPARLQSLLEIQIAAQRGECEKARQLQAQYRQQFR